MKKTFFLTAMLSLGMCSAFAATVTPSTGTNYTAGHVTTDPNVGLGSNMTFGQLTSTSLGDGAIPYGGDFWAGDYTLSLWVDTSSISTQTTLFSYYGGAYPDGYGANALVLNADGTLSMGCGSFNSTTGLFHSDRGDSTDSLIRVALGTGGGLTNITLSVTGRDGNQSVNIYLNGSLLDTLTYNGNMNGNLNPTHSWLNENLTYGEIKTQSGALTADQIAAFAGLGKVASVPEPATATLSLLGLAALAMRRRRA